MSLNIEILKDTEYAEALKEALKLRRDGTITSELDDQLGIMAHSIAQWAIASAVKAGKLWRTWSTDVDFQANVLFGVVKKLDSVDLDREPKEIIMYLYRVGRSAIKDQLHYAGAAKRQHEEISLDGIVQTANFYGEPTGGIAYEIESDSRS